MANEFFTALRETLAAVTAADPHYQRFGAAQHRYELAPVLGDLEARTLPDELRAYATTIAGGGAGPYYGLLPLGRTSEIVAAPGVTAWQRALPIGHLGCGYAVVMPLDGDARDQVWIDARGVGLVAPMYASFTVYYIDWIDRIANARLPESFVPPGRCALASALAGYLAVQEQRLGLPPDGLDGALLAEVIASLGPGAIAIANEGPLFAADQPVAPCVQCTLLLDHLGLPRSVLRT